MPQTLSEHERRALAALRKFIYTASGADPEEKSVVEAAADLAEHIEDQRERIATLEATVERLEATSSGPELSKRERHEAIINAAENKASGDKGVKLDYGEVMAAANVSRRYAYTLMDTLGASYDWAYYDTSGNRHVLKIDRMGCDWAGLITSVHKNTSK